MLTRKGKIFAYIFIGLSPIFLVILGFLIIIGFILIFVVLSIISDTPRINNLNEQLINSLPSEHLVVEQDTTVGDFYSNYNNMSDYLSVALINSDLSLEELQEHYNSYQFEHISTDKRLVEEPILVHVGEVKELPLLTPFTPQHSDYQFFEEIELESFDDMYYVAVIDYGYLNRLTF